MTEPLIIGQISLTFHAAAAAIICELLREVGHKVILKEAPHERMYEMQQAGEVDLLISAWLPASHGKYVAPYENALCKLSTIYKPYCIWGISDIAPDHIRSVEDLANPDIAILFQKRIQGIAPGAGISRFSRQMIEDYELAEHGFYFENGSLEDCTNAFLNAEKAGKLAIIPLWHPQWLHREVSLRELTDPKGLLGGEDKATLVLRQDSKHKLSKQGYRLLENIYLGNKVISELDHDICVDKQTPRNAACAWIEKNRSLVDSWLLSEHE